MLSSLKVAVITGASSGIGRVTAVALSKTGWSLVLFARRTAELEGTRLQCADPAKVACFAGDVTSEQSLTDLFEVVEKTFGRVDLLFNNAGVLSSSVPLEEIELSTFQHAVQVNFVGSFLCTREAFKIFKKQSLPGGRIINNRSVAAQVPRPQALAYTTSKHAITGLTKSTALGGRPHNVTCTQIDIGGALTPIFNPMAQEGTVQMLQADGSLAPEATFDVKHVADSVVHIAELPLDVTVSQYTIMAAKMPFVGRGWFAESRSFRTTV